MIWLQLSANTGPVECCLAVSKALKKVLQEAEGARVDVTVVEQVDGPVAGTLRSILLGLEDVEGSSAAETLAQRWCGSFLWICSSTYRVGHKRKNWFLAGAVFFPAPALPAGEIRFEATRASGPGGQHVNKTDSAIRATHVATGLSVKVQTERSQHANKKLAAALLAHKLANIAEAVEGKQKAERRMQHHQAERGNASRTFVGLDFKERGET